MTDIQLLQRSQLKLSPTKSQGERRDHYDKNAIAELADSLSKVGMLQPIVARPVNGHFEIVAGERRYLAAGKAGLETVPVNVRELTDEEVLEVQLVENLQREGLHELAEAEGYEALIQNHKYTADQVVAKVGKSRSYVYGRLKLLELTKESRKAFYAGKLSASHALLLARIPNAGLQNEALKDITESRYGDSPMSFREARDHIERGFMLRLAEAPFDIKNAALIPNVGACGGCPKRTGNSPDLFGDIKGADVCTDPPCFKLKVASHNAQVITSAKANGQRVLVGAEAKKAVTYEHEDNVNLSQAYAKLDDTCYDDPKHRTYKQILGADVKPIIIKTPKGQVVEAIERKEATKLLKASGSKKSTTRTEHKSKHEEQRANSEKLNGRIFKAIFDKVDVQLREATERLIVDALDILGMTEEVYGALGWEVPKGDKLAASIENLSARDLARLAYVMPLADDLGGYGQARKLTDSAKELKIDLAKIKVAIAAEDKATKVAAAAEKKQLKPKTSR